MRIAVDGVIGSGKSTAIRALCWKLNVRVHPEPIASWARLLERFYANPAAGTMDLQVRVMLDFAKIEDDGEIHVVERSPDTSHEVFGSLARRNGFLSDDQWTTLKDLREKVGWSPDLIVYIDTPVDVCARRIEERSGKDCAREPKDVSYLRDVAAAYETMLRFAKAPVVRIDGTLPPDEVLAKVVDAVRSFAGIADD